MNKFFLATFALVAFLGFAGPAAADHVGVGVYFGGGGGCCYHRGGWGGYPYYPAYAYPGYYPYYYDVAPPPTVVYAPPPTVVYSGAPQTVQAPVQASAPVSAAPQGAAPDQGSTYTDSSGRTCREFQSSAKIAGSVQPTYGTVCMQPDGTWRVVP